MRRVVPLKKGFDGMKVAATRGVREALLESI